MNIRMISRFVWKKFGKDCGLGNIADEGLNLVIGKMPKYLAGYVLMPLMLN
jgi:hypothetical protein